MKPKKLTVFGLWHLGCVMTACCSRHHRVVGLDLDAQNIAKLQRGEPPIFEPGLSEALAAGVSAGAVSFTDDPLKACAETDLLWVCFDTPVDQNDQSDSQFVLERVRTALQFLRTGTLVLISSQLPVGTCKTLEAEYPKLRFASAPENLRLGRAIVSFLEADRIVLGVRDHQTREELEVLLKPFGRELLFMKVESAEMLKHALNSFLALSVTFINEIGRLCEHVGADAVEVSKGLKTDQRIGPKAYLSPGGAFAGGTLARDVCNLVELGRGLGERLAVVPAIKASNDQHRGWSEARLRFQLGSLSGKRVCVMGLTYTPNTDTLRRSVAVELCRTLLDSGAQVIACDPVVRELPSDLGKVQLVSDVIVALSGADAAVLCTEWPQFRSANWGLVIQAMRRALILDPNSFLENELKSLEGVEHVAVGRPPK